MRPEKQQMSFSWFNKLTSNEQSLIVFGGMAVFLVLTWTLVYRPVLKHIDQKVAVKHNLKQQFQEMQSLTGLSGNQNTVQLLTIPTGVTFSSWVDQQLKQVDLQQMVNRTEPVDNQRLVVWLQAAPFDQTIDWLQNIAAQYAVLVDQIDVNVVDSNLGLVNIRMRLVR